MTTTPDHDQEYTEYLDWLGTLTCEVGGTPATGNWRISRDPSGEVVRIETWTPIGSEPETWSYYRFGR